MSRTVKCVLLGVESEGLDRPTYPGDLGQRVFDNVWGFATCSATIVLSS